MLDNANPPMQAERSKIHDVGAVPWGYGQPILYRFRRLDGSLGTVHPARVVEDDGDRLLCWVVAGTPIRITTAPDGRLPRQLPLDERFRTRRVPARSVWSGTTTLRLVYDHRWASVWWFFSPEGQFLNWYVNLEVPLGRDATGINRADGVLDIEVFPDGRWAWKDVDEIEPALAAGRFERVHLNRLRLEADRMIALAEAGRFPFDGTYCSARPDQKWSAPELPEECLT